VLGAGVEIGPGASVTVDGAATFTTNGDWKNDGTFTAGLGTVEFVGFSSTLLEPGVSPFNHLVIRKTAVPDADDNVSVANDPLAVAGTLTVDDGELLQGTTDFSLGPLSISAAGKYSNLSSGDLTLAGNVSSAGTVQFDSGGAGPGGLDTIRIRSSVSGAQRNWQGAGTFSMSDVDVKDQSASGGTPAAIAVASGTNSGNNLNWLFGGVTLAGTAYASKAELATLPNRDLKIVQLGPGGPTTYTATTDGTGAFSVGMTDAQDGDPILVYLDDETEEGNLVYVSDGLNASDLKLYAGAVALRNDSGAGITNAQLAGVDDADDDVKYAVSGGTATFESTFELFIFTGSVYAPAGPVNFHDLDLNGTFQMGASPVSCLGTWDATGGVYASTGTVTFSATTPETLTSNGASALAAFRHVVFSGAGGTWTLQDALDVDGHLTLSAGTLDAAGFDVFAGGDWTNTASFVSGAGRVVFDGLILQAFVSAGTGVAADDATRDFQDVEITGSTLRVAAGSELEVDGTLTVAAARTLDLNAAALDLNGTLSNVGVVALEGSETLGLGTWDTDSGTTRFTGDTVTLPAALTAYFNLEIDETVDGQTFTLPDTAVTVNGTLVVADGILAFDDDKALAALDSAVTSTALSVLAAGTLRNLGVADLTLGGGFLNAGTVVFDSSDDAGDGIAIASSNVSQRNWQGTGAFSFSDVTVSRQTVIGGGPSSLTAVSSTDGGNNTNWLFAGGLVDNASVTPANLESGKTSNVTTVLRVQNAIPSNGAIRVTFPAGFSVAGVTGASSAADLDGTLSISILGQAVTVTRAGGTNFAAGGTADDLILAGVTNPIPTGVTGAFTIETLDAGGQTIDSGSAAGITIVPSTSSASAGEFTDSAGTPAASYTVASTTTGRVYVSLADSDENGNGAAAETVVVTVSSTSTADQETVILTETGINTGVFNNLATGLELDADDPQALGNGVLETRNGDTITLSYTDDDEPLDTATDTAVFLASDELITAELSVTPQNIRVGETMFFSGSIENRTSDTLSDFRLVADLPPGISFQAESVTTDGAVLATTSGSTVTISGLEGLTPGAKRTVKFRAIAGAAITPGTYTASLYAQINPVISNTALVTLTVKPDPVFHIGTLIGKVFWDIDKDGVQDEGEAGIPNVTVATEQGYVITTDRYGRYHVPDFLSGRHMIKLDRGSLPAGARLTTPESVVVNQTDAMLQKVNFGVLIPESAASLIDTERDSEVTLMLRKDTESPKKRFELEFHEIAPHEEGSRKGELRKVSGAEYATKNVEGEAPVLPFRVDANYAEFVKSWSFSLGRVTKREDGFAFEDPARREREVLEEARESGAPTAAAFRYAWTLPLEDKDGPIPYELRVALEDAKGNRDVAVYDLTVEPRGDETLWKLVPVRKTEGIPVRGSNVIVEGTTHAGKVVSIRGREDLSGTDGTFRHELILPAGRQVVPVTVALEPEPVEIRREIDLRDTYFFFVGFSEYEYGQLSAKGNLQSLTEDDKARLNDTWYDESRVAYYLKGKVKGKYLVTASVDTEREKRNLFRDLEPEDYYAVYGDGSTVTADAADTQDKYFLLIEADKSSFRYGNFNTDFNGTEFSDFNRTLHGAKLHYETLSMSPDGKPVTVVKIFTATARQTAAYNEFASTGGSLYYLKHQDVIQGSAKVRIVTRDKTSGLALEERALSLGQDYSIDYDQGRLRLYRPLSLFSYESDTILSTELLPGHPQYVVVEYEYLSRETAENLAHGARATHSLLNNALRLGGTYVTEEKALKKYELRGTDAALRLPWKTEITGEIADSTLQGNGEFLSENGGLTFTEISRPSSEEGGQAYKITFASSPLAGTTVRAYYRTMGQGFSSSGTVSEAGTNRYGLELDQKLGEYGKLLVRREAESLAEGVPFVIEEFGASSEQTTDTVQYKYLRGRFEGTVEYRNAVQTDLNERLFGAEAKYAWRPDTRFSLGAQTSMSGEPNDQIRAGIERDLDKELTIRATQAFGSKGYGARFGLDSLLGGHLRSFSHGTGSLSDEPVENDSTPTNLGFTKKIGKDSEFSIDEGISGEKKRALRFTRSVDGKTLELVRETDSTGDLASYSETEELSPGVTRYRQTAVKDERLTKNRIESKVDGYKAELWGGRGSLFKEDVFSTDGKIQREGSKQGIGLKVGAFGHVDASYERNEDSGSDTDSSYQIGRVVYDYFEYEKLTWKNEWELRLDDAAEDTTQLFSAGKAQWTLTPEWTVVGRYEWSWSENVTTGVKSAAFSEIQTGAAYRPVKNDRWNFFGEYKFLDDQAPAGQFDLDSEDSSRRHILRGEVAYDIHPRVTLVEKLAVRGVESMALSGTMVESFSYFAAQRVNFHLTDRWDLIAEYRFLGQTLANDATHGALIETSYRVTDALRVSVGYNMADFESKAARDLSVETRGMYVRVFYDALEEVRGVIERRRGKSLEAAGRLGDELERALSIRGREKSAQEIRSRLRYARDLMEKQLYDEAIEILQDGLERVEEAKLYGDRARQKEARFDFYVRQGGILESHGLHAAAFRSYEKAYRINAFHEGLLDRMAAVRRQIQKDLETKRAIRRERQQAFEALKKIADSDALLYETIQLHYVTGRKCFDKGLYEEAMREWQAGRELARRVETDFKLMTDERKELVTELGKLNEEARRLFDAGRYEEAKQTLKKGVELLRSVR